MKRISQRFLFVTAFGLFTSSAMAVVPADGIWWNPNESGRGYTIEDQNGILVMTAYTYNNDRTSTFLQAAGPFNELGTTWSAELVQSTGGQCFGCTYQNPTRTSAGTVSITFTSAESGVITYPGGSSSIVHFPFGFSENQQNYLYGEWSFEYQILGTVFAQWVVFDSTYTGSDGTLYIAGFEDSLSTSTTALGILANGEFIIAITDGTFDDLYDFAIFTDRYMIGAGEIYSAGGTPPPPNNVAVGNRLQSQSTLTASGSTNAGQANEGYSIPGYSRDADLQRLATMIRSQIHR